MKEKVNNKHTYIAVVLMAVIALLCILTASCKSPTLVARDTIYVNRIVTNVELQHDSIFVDRYHDVVVKGDSVLVKDSVYIYKYLYSHDTLVKVDSIRVVEEVPVEVVKSVTPRWCKWLLLVNIIGVGAFAWWKFNKK